MSRLRIFLSRLRGLFLKRNLEQELADEIQSHLEMQIEDYERQGMNPDEARYLALRKFGGVDQVKEALKHSRGTSMAVSRLSKGLLVLQLAVSFLLLMGAGLFIRTLYNLQRVDVGFNQENLLVFTLQPEDSGYKDERLLQFYQQLFSRLDHLPGVRAVTFGRIPLIANGNWFDDFLLPRRE